MVMNKCEHESKSIDSYTYLSLTGCIFQEIVLSAEQDEWYREHMYQNFGEVGTSLRDLVNQYQQKTQTHKSISTLSKRTC